MNWLTMCLRYDLAYTTKELSRVLQEPTKIANEILRRAINYIIQTKNAHLQFNHGDTSLQRQDESRQIRKKQLMTRNTTYRMEFHKLTTNNKSKITNTQNPKSPKCASPISIWLAKLKPDKAQAD